MEPILSEIVFLSNEKNIANLKTMSFSERDIKIILGFSFKSRKVFFCKILSPAFEFRNLKMSWMGMGLKSKL